MPDRPPLPVGLRLVADPSLVRRDAGRVLIGGSPFRLTRVSSAGAALVQRWLAGQPVRAGAEAALARRLVDTGTFHPQPEARVRPDVAVVIPVKDDLVAEPAPSAAARRVFVVDDGSSPPLEAIAGADVLRRDISGGPGAARSDGLAAARAAGASFVAFIDADVSADPDWIDRLLGHFDDPMVAAVAPRVASAPGRSNLAAYETAFSPLDLGDTPSLVAPGRRVSYVPTAALIVRVEVIDAIGGFDPALRYGEDVDLVWRLAAAGFDVRYDPSVVVNHRPRASWSAWLRQRMSYGSAAAPLATRHGDPIAPARAPAEVYGTIAAAVVAPLPVVAAAALATVGAAQRRVRSAIGDHHQPAVVNQAMAHAFGSTIAAIPRAWGPFALLLGVVGRRPRRRLAVMVTSVAAVEVALRRPTINPLVATLVRVLDHTAYGVGVWRGVIAERSFGAVRPARSERGVRTGDADPTTVGS